MIVVFGWVMIYKFNFIKEKKIYIIKLNFVSIGMVMNLKSWKNLFLYIIEDLIFCIFLLYEYKWKNFNKKYNIIFVNYLFRIFMIELILVIKLWLYDLNVCYYWIILKSISDVWLNRLFLFVC